MSDRPSQQQPYGQGQTFRHSMHGQKLSPLSGSSPQATSPAAAYTPSASTSQSPGVGFPPNPRTSQSISPQRKPLPPSAAARAANSPPPPTNDQSRERTQFGQGYQPDVSNPGRNVGQDYFTQPLLTSSQQPNLYVTTDDDAKARGRKRSPSTQSDPLDMYDASGKDKLAHMELLVRRAEFRRKANWKPVPMKTLYLIILALFSAGVIVGIEILKIMSQRPQNTQVPDGEPPPKGIVRYKQQNLNDLSIWRYFAWNYLPILIQVAYGIFWEATDSAVKKCEPYYQLTSAKNHEKGCLGSHSLTVNYFEFWIILTPFQAVSLRHWAVFCSSAASILAFGLAPLFQSGLFNVRHFDDASDPFIVIVDPVFSRLLQGTLGLILIFDIALMFILGSRRTGLLHDPAPIAAIASIAAESDGFLAEFRGVMTERTKAMENRFATQRYRLNLSEREDDGRLVYRIENTGFGVRPDVLHLEKHRLFQKMSLTSRTKAFFARVGEKLIPPDGHPPILHLLCIVPFVLVLIFNLLFFIGLYMWLQHVPSFLNFHKALGYFSARTTSIIFTGVSISLKTVWGIVDRSLRMLQPYYTLNKQNAPASRSIFLDYTATVPLWIVAKAAYHGDGLLALTAVMSALVEVYTVTVGSSVNFALALYQEETKKGNVNYDNASVTLHTGNISFILTIIILSSMIICTVIVYAARRTPFLPRDIGNMASVVSLLYASSLLNDDMNTTKSESGSMSAGGLNAGAAAFKGLSITRDLRGNDRMFELLRHRRYGFGWFRAKEPLPPALPPVSATTAEPNTFEYYEHQQRLERERERERLRDEEDKTWCLGIEDSSKIEAAGAYMFGDERMDQAVRRQQRWSKGGGLFGLRKRRTLSSDNPADNYRSRSVAEEEESVEMLGGK